MSSTTMMIFSCLIATFIAYSTATVPCCDFETSTCSWDTVSWNTAPDTVPDNTSYPGFLPPDASYRWLQDKSGTLSTTANYSIDAAGEVISMDYYFYAPNYITGDYLNVVFRNAQTKRTNRIARITTSKDAWQHYEITCDFRVNYCCGSLAAVPCSGTFEITGNLNLPTTKGLFGLDNFGECNSITTVTPTSNTEPGTTTLYTLPPPVQRDCCRFESDVCGFSSSDWYWSANKPSPYPIVDYSSNYLWTDVNGSFVTSLPQINVRAETTFSVTYFINSTWSKILVTFLEDGETTPRSVGTLVTYTPGVWNRREYYFAGLCTLCNGTLSLQAILSGPNEVVAIDDADRDAQCFGTFPCCYFDDSFFCNLNHNETQWKWSGDSDNEPTFPVPSPGSQFVYFEMLNYDGETDIYAPLHSDEVNIDSDVVFVGNFYGYTSLGLSGTESLQLNFRWFNIPTVVTMDFVVETYGEWMQVTFKCQSAHGQCCSGYSTCQGYLEFVAHVQPHGGSVFYGIDAVSVNGRCSPFPGLTMISGSGNSTFIPLHQ